MKLYQEMILYPPRFETLEDAQLYQECLSSGKKFPKDKWIHPFVERDGMIMPNRRYQDAQFEEKYIYSNETT